MADDTVRRHVTISGEVQGVFFRETARRKATEAGVAGWITNRSDGRVEAVFEGPAEAVDELVEFCGHGPTAATVEDVDVQTEEPESLSGFDVR
jgi:acylphosphatase